MKRVQTILPAAGIFCLALVVRLLYNNIAAQNYVLVGDALSYHRLAVNILTLHCFCVFPHANSVDHAPLWPLILAAIYSLVGPNTYIVRVFLCVVDASTCLLVYLFAKDVFSRRIGILAGLLAAVYPQLYIYVDWLYSETLYIFLLFAFCYAVLRLQRTAQRRWLALCGVLLAMVSLVRPNGLLVFAVFLLWLVLLGWRKSLPWRFVGQSALVVSLIVFVCIVPWTVRNYIISQTFIPVTTGDGTVLIGSYNDTVLVKPGSIGKWINPKDVNPAWRKYSPADPVPLQIERENIFRQAALQWIESHIRSLPFLWKYHFQHMWDKAPDEVYFPNDAGSRFFYKMTMEFPTLIFPLAVFGLLVSWKRWRELLFLYLLMVLITAECVFFYGSARLSSPIQPLVLILVAGGVWWLTHREAGTLHWLILALDKRQQMR